VVARLAGRTDSTTMANGTIPSPAHRSERQMTARDPVVVGTVLARAWRRDSY
jgi:hypothetical protein